MSEPNSTNSEHDPFSLEDEDTGASKTGSPTGTEPSPGDGDEDGDGDGDGEDDADDEDDKASAEADAEAARLAEKESADLRRADAKRRQDETDRRRTEGSRAPRADAPVAAAEPRPAKMLVRVRPYNAKRGQTMRTHSRMHDGARATFQEGRGWYDVSHALAEELRQVRCSDMDPDSALAFDVCTPREARRVDEREEAALEQETRAPAQRPRSAT